MSDIPDYMYQLIASVGISQNMPGLVITSGPSSGSLFNGTSGFTGFTFSGNTGDFSGITVDIVSGFEGSYGSGVQAFTYSGNTADLSGATIDIISGFLGAYGSGVTGFTMSGNTADLSGATIDIVSGMQGGFASGVIAPTLSGTQFTASGVISPIISGSRAVLNSGLEVPTISGTQITTSGINANLASGVTANFSGFRGRVLYGIGADMRLTNTAAGRAGLQVYPQGSQTDFAILNQVMFTDAEADANNYVTFWGPSVRGSSPSANAGYTPPANSIDYQFFQGGTGNMSGYSIVFAVPTSASGVGEVVRMVGSATPWVAALNAVISGTISGQGAYFGSGQILNYLLVSGRIGVGTTVPSERFHLAGQSGTNLKILIQNSGGDNADVQYKNTAGDWIIGVRNTNGNWRAYDNDGARVNFTLTRSGYVVHFAPNTAIANADLDNSNISFYLNEAGNTLTVKAKYSDGTVKTGTVALA